ncbi:CLUMA_CG001879, isoform A [Clunio marinus]|uniref:CLUMA_CG001879, isoform A n=1 Tax=Clunio marinus TaxID=568069 RepID=A0A1J1HNP7_9DIPT|nr:CLUMA_CG001879, isoform A [Clunio marinus]
MTKANCHPATRLSADSHYKHLLRFKRAEDYYHFHRPMKVRYGYAGIWKHTLFHYTQYTVEPKTPFAAIQLVYTKEEPFHVFNINEHTFAYLYDRDNTNNDDVCRWSLTISR